MRLKPRNGVGTAHIVGAGLAGLNTALLLLEAGHKVVLYEASGYAGGRCRSYLDPILGIRVDNGNHLMLSANHHVLDYVARIGAERELIHAPARFPFVDLNNGARWEIDAEALRKPWRLLRPKAKPPTSRWYHWLQLRHLIDPPPMATIAACLAAPNPLHTHLVTPLGEAILNTSIDDAAAILLSRVLRQSLLRGAAYSQPLLARNGLGAALIDPALQELQRHGMMPHYHHRLHHLETVDDQVTRLDFGHDVVDIAPGDSVIMALPAPVLARLLTPQQGLALRLDPAITTNWSPIINAHIRLQHPLQAPLLIGVINGTAQWFFTTEHGISATISAADALINQNAETLAKKIWHDSCAVYGLDPDRAKKIRIVKEKRATFRQTPHAAHNRPPTQTPIRNLLLAGDWTDTGLPATIESALLSGVHAANRVQAVAVAA